METSSARRNSGSGNASMRGGGGWKMEFGMDSTRLVESSRGKLDSIKKVGTVAVESGNDEDGRGYSWRVMLRGQKLLRSFPST
ncbi:hypothetical protein H6P81_000057 [Aristolochia fimbriata]|uniref:Uncharacterized protein n=1 Tax=Aristolochia fimbriata TaxID=158543 RepID=A0AAV7F3R8_ARIFI|nr:hypothetical protein H6P81_000057 [Aristolochia fimbriata]